MKIEMFQKMAVTYKMYYKYRLIHENELSGAVKLHRMLYNVI